MNDVDTSKYGRLQAANPLTLAAALSCALVDGFLIRFAGSGSSLSDLEHVISKEYIAQYDKTNILRG